MECQLRVRIDGRSALWMPKVLMIQISHFYQLVNMEIILMMIASCMKLE